MKHSLMKENAFGIVGKFLAALCVLVLAAASVSNAWRGDVPRPALFGVALVGCALFLTAKFSVIARARLISFGTRAMSPAMANLYSAGYWLMAVGVLATFA